MAAMVTLLAGAWRLGPRVPPGTSSSLPTRPVHAAALLHAACVAPPQCRAAGKFWHPQECCYFSGAGFLPFVSRGQLVGAHDVVTHVVQPLKADQAVGPGFRDQGLGLRARQDWRGHTGRLRLSSTAEAAAGRGAAFRQGRGG